MFVASNVKVTIAHPKKNIVFLRKLLSFAYNNIGGVDMQVIELERGIGLPPVRVVYAYPYETMAIGDSFTVPKAARAKVLNANYRAGKRLSMTFVARTDGDLVRVWRMT